MNETSLSTTAFPAPEALRRTGGRAPLAKTPHACEAVSLGEIDVTALIERAQRGDRAALERLLAEVRPRALAAAMKVLRSPDDAEDAVQDAFLKVWRSLARFEGRASFTTWIHRIVVNASLDLLRRQSCRPGLVTGSNDDDPIAEEVVDVNDETPERALARAETGAVVREALASLSPAHREAIELRELSELSYDEIAVTAGCPVGTVMSRLHHARRRLAEELSLVMPPAAGGEPLLCAA